MREFVVAKLAERLVSKVVKMTEGMFKMKGAFYGYLCIFDKYDIYTYTHTHTHTHTQTHAYV